MKYVLNCENLLTLETDCLIVPILAKNTLGKAVKLVDQASGKLISHAIKQEDVTGKLGSSLLVTKVPGIRAKRVLLMGVEVQTDFNLNHAQQFADRVTALLGKQCKNAVIAFDDILNKTLTKEKLLEQFMQAFNQANYQFNDYKSAEKAKKLLGTISFHAQKTEEKKLNTVMKKTGSLLGGINFTKDLCNTPGNICTPHYLAEQAVKLGKSLKSIKVKIHDVKAIKRLKMGALYGVAKGSAEAPYFIEMHYNGSNKKDKPVVLIGKGVTFDSGGISLKPGAGMEEMKYDMGGAASVLGALHAIAEMRLPVNVIGLIPTVENMPNGHAYKPGDVLTSMSGKTIEIVNTDAEGRLILCDALTYAKKFKPDLIVDIATLTGAMVVSLGHVRTGIFSRDMKLSDQFYNAGQAIGDKAWPMPLDDEYQKEMNSHIADMRNAGTTRYAGAITAACFLSRFVDKDQPWVHLDIAGSAWHGGHSVGATGRPVPLLVQYLETCC